MSPLARSLLMLAVLLAAADGTIIDLNEPPGSLCHGIEFVGLPRTYEHQVVVSFNFKSFEDKELHEIEDHCMKHGLHLIDQIVRACNGYKRPSAPNWFPPEIHAIGDQQRSLVFASCRNNPECKPIEFHVNQTCVEHI